MEKNKMHKLDSIFMVGIMLIAIIAAVTDIFYWKDAEYGGFPVFSCMSIYASYALLIILLIYSWIKNKEEKNELNYVRPFMLFALPFLHIAFVVVGFIIGNVLVNFLFS